MLYPARCIQLWHALCTLWVHCCNKRRINIHFGDREWSNNNYYASLKSYSVDQRRFLGSSTEGACICSQWSILNQWTGYQHPLPLSPPPPPLSWLPLWSIRQWAINKSRCFFLFQGSIQICGNWLLYVRWDRCSHDRDRFISQLVLLLPSNLQPYFFDSSVQCSTERFENFSKFFNIPSSTFDWLLIHAHTLCMAVDSLPTVITPVSSCVCIQSPKWHCIALHAYVCVLVNAALELV